MTGRTDYSDATRATGEAIIELEGVDKFFGDFQALKGIDMRVGRQEVVVVIGPSGGGKSTLIRCINRLEKHDAAVWWSTGSTFPTMSATSRRCVGRPAWSSSSSTSSPI